MKSVKFYFSLLLSAVMLSLSMPAMAQEDAAAEVAEEAVEAIAIAEVAEVAEVAEEAHVAPAQGSEGRDNAEIDAEFSVGKAVSDFIDQAGFNGFFQGDNWKCAVMLLISFVLLYLAIVKKFEPLLLMPIAFGMLLTNLPGAGLFHSELFAGGHVHWADFAAGSGVGLLDYLYLGVKLGIYPCLIFVGVGAMTDFGPLIANPKSLLLGAAAQIGIFATFLGALALGFNYWEAGSIGIIGGADGPTAIYITSKLAPHLLGPIAVAAYSYMALVPVIQPPIMKLLTTKEQRQIKMKPARQVSQTEKMLFPIVGLLITTFIVPSGLPLLGMLFFGNLLKESTKTTRLAKTAGSALNDIVVMLLGLTVGCSTQASEFLTLNTIFIFIIGACAFVVATASGVLFVHFMNLFLPKSQKLNPLIGNAGVSAVPMAARISQQEGLKADPHNYLLMHAMGPNVAGVIGTAVAAGTFMAIFGVK